MKSSWRNSIDSIHLGRVTQSRFLGLRNVVLDERRFRLDRGIFVFVYRPAMDVRFLGIAWGIDEPMPEGRTG